MRAKARAKTTSTQTERDEQIKAEALEQNLRFQGQYLDRDTGLHYNTFRYYDADIGRFISPDPIGLHGGHNLASYAPNPAVWVDPFGLTGDPAKATHVTYIGVKDGKPYVGYASKPGLGHSAEDVLKYRYPNMDHFDVKPQAVYKGDGQAGKDVARGLEQRLFEDNGGLKGTSNRQNPVGEGNARRDTYLKAADEYRAANSANEKVNPKGKGGC